MIILSHGTTLLYALKRNESQASESLVLVFVHLFICYERIVNDFNGRNRHSLMMLRIMMIIIYWISVVTPEMMMIACYKGKLQ